jgi:hypothetical protein
MLATWLYGLQAEFYVKRLLRERSMTETWDGNIRQAVLALNRILTQYNRWGHKDRDHIFATRNLMADEWSVMDSMVRHGEVRPSCSHSEEPGEPEIIDCNKRATCRCRSCGFKFCDMHCNQVYYSGAHVPADEEYSAHICIMCDVLDPYRLTK